MPKSDYDRATSQVLSQRAQLAGLRAQQRVLKEDLRSRSGGSERGASTSRELEARAPMAGTVLRRAVMLGDFVKQDTPLFVIGDLSNLVVECLVDETDVARLTPTTAVKIGFRAFEGQAFVGRILEIPPDADRERHAFLVKVQILQPPAGLRSGMGAEVNFVLDRHEGGLLVPPEAIDRAGAVPVVNGHVVERREVTLGVRGRSRVEVQAGLGAGELVVVSSPLDLHDGMRVRAITRGPTGGDGR